MAYVDYTYYSTSFGGTTIPETDFVRQEKKARVFLDNITFDRLKIDATLIDDNVRDCLCDVMECKYKLDNEKINNDEANGKIIASETTDKHSVTYAISDLEKNAIDRSQLDKVKTYNIAKEYLGNTGLLYRGV